MSHNKLKCLYLQFTNKEISKEDFELEVYQYLIKYRNETSLRNLEQNEFDDFISWFYPRLANVIDSYYESNSSFDVYLNSVLRLASKEYRVKTTTKSIIEYSAWSVQVPEIYVSEDAPEYIYENKIDNSVNIKNERKKSTRQILTLLLKSYYYVSDELLDKAASYTGIEKKTLEVMINKLKAIRQKRDDEIYLMKERIHNQFYRCIVYEKRLKLLSEDSIAYINLKQKLEKARKRLSGMRKRLKGVRTDATNKQVADAIGVSKGTVDATLHKLKSKWLLN